MNRAFLSIVKSMFVAMLAVSTIAAASEEKAPAKADIAKGEALYANGDAARNIPSCLSCHGTAGNSTIVQNPRLAGQHEAYINKQLHDFKGPDRVQAIMSTYAKAMSEEQMKNVAAYLETQAPKQGAAKNKDIVKLGQKIYRGGIDDKHIPACAGCHSPTGAGMPVQYPRIAGQHQDYTIAQLGNFRAGTRKNSPQMAKIAKNMSDEEVKAVADYIAGLK